MEAIRYTVKTNKLEYSTIPIPKISSPTDVLVKIAYAGVCGTDLHIIQGEFPCTQTKTFTLGHESAGTVVEVGPDVTTLKKGDKVAIDPNNGCHCCHDCHSGNYHYCKMGPFIDTYIGTFADGGWAQYVVASVQQVQKLPDTITLEQAALTEPLSCLTHGWDIISPIPVGSKILIIGAGIIGNLWVAVLHLHGHRRVTVSEPNVARLNTIKKLNTGFDLVTPDELKKRQSSDPDYLFDVVIDCSGFPPAVEHAVSLLQFGGKLCCFGVSPPHGKITIAPFDIYMKELTIYGVKVNPFSFPKAMGLLEAMGDRYLNYDTLGIKTYQLKEYESALNDLKKGTISKAVFKI